MAFQEEEARDNMTEMVTRRACCKTIAPGAVAAPFAPALLAAARKGEMGLKPMIKHRGGKAKEFGEYERFIPNDVDTCYEPFLGGGATFFRLMPRKAVVGDINEPLMNFYGDVRNRYGELMTADCEVSFRWAGTRDFMFLDSPYDCIFNDYGNQDVEKDGFAEKDHRRLARLFRGLKCRALMVIGHTPLTEELYGDLVKAEYAKSYAVNIRNRFKPQATHYVVTNYEV